VENGKATTRRHERWAGPPLELSVLCAPRNSLLRRKRLRLRKRPSSDEK
jgi:hypothetical protein